MSIADLRLRWIETLAAAEKAIATAYAGGHLDADEAARLARRVADDRDYVLKVL